MISRKQYLFLIFLFIAFCYSCNNPFPGYDEKEEGLYKKLLSFDDSEDGFQENRYVSADIKIIKNNEIVYRQYKEELKEPKQQLAFLYSYLNKDDSAEFKISSALIDKYFSEMQLIGNTEEYLTAYVKIYDYKTNQGEKIDAEMQEQMLLNKYIKENKKVEKKHGVYIINEKSGAGEKITNGKDITVQYKGRFLNQIEFDNSTINFTYGTPEQVIKGLEKALKGMRKGEKAKIIIPSQLAFGEEGSSTQVVPPFTTVIYEIEIINVK